MSFTGNEDHYIDLEKATAWTANFRANMAPGETLGEFFGKEYIQSILEQKGCVGIRIYHSLDEDGNKHLIICGVDAQEDDLHAGIIAEAGFRSPPFSGVNSPLNS